MHEQKNYSKTNRNPLEEVETSEPKISNKRFKLIRYSTKRNKMNSKDVSKKFFIFSGTKK